MAVVDRNKLLTRRVDRAEGLQLFAWIDLVARGRRRMHVLAADDARDPAIAPGEQATGFARRFLAGVRDDLIAYRRSEPQRVGYLAPPAIAGMTMTSLPSGTAAPVPPFARASSSPM
jgi:hypothetical protein